MTRSRMRKLKRAQTTRARTVMKMVPVASAIFGVIHPALGQEQPAGTLQEVVVTATKRTENLQNVPLSIVAIGTEQLEQLNIQKSDDYIRFLPSVTSQGGG